MGGMSGNPTAMQNYAAWYGLNALNKIDTSAVDNANLIQGKIWRADESKSRQPSGLCLFGERV